MKPGLAVVALTCAVFCNSSVAAEAEERLNQLQAALPEDLSAALAQEPYRSKYDLSDAVNPFYLKGDYDGDGHADYLVMVTEIPTKQEKGLAFVSSRKEAIVLYDSAKISHHRLDAWLNCEWKDCGRTLRGRDTKKGHRPIPGRDMILFRFGGPNVIWFWNGKEFVSKGIPGE